ncbi:MAG: AMP-binding protein [Chitinophagales bacterium]
MQLYETLRKSGKKYGERTAFIEASGNLSYAGFWAKVEQRKQDLLEIGIQKNDGVGILFDNSSDFMLHLLAVLGTGAVAMPVSIHFKQDELKESIRATGLNWLIADVNQTNWRASDFEKKPLDERVAYAHFPEHTKLKSKLQQFPDPAFIRYTSGTTGLSKGVLITHTAVLQRIQAANEGLKLDASDRVLWVLPMTYHFMVSMILYLEQGLCLIIAPDFTADTLVGRANAYKATMLYASPFHIRLLSTAKGKSFSTLKRVISTSAGISPELCRQFEENYNLPVSQAYGIIEIGLPLINLEHASECPESVGKPLPDYEVVILDKEANIAGKGEKGQLAIKGPGMFAAYLEPFMLQNQVLFNGYFLTGDTASIDEKGLVRIEGRTKSMINVSGNKVFPEEVEGVLEQHPAVQMAKAEKADHPLLGEIVVAKIILKEGKYSDIEAIQAFCKERLSSFKIPRNIEIVKDLEMTKTGKIKRH